MRRFVYLVSLVWFSMVSSMAASPTVYYESPHTELSYQYVLQDEGSKAELWVYDFRTEDGPLQLTVRSNETGFSVTSDLKGSISKEIVTLGPPTVSGVAEIELEWPDQRIQATYAKHEGTDDLELLSGWIPDCETLMDGELARARRDLLERVNRDYFAYVEPPRHLETLVVALHSARIVPLASSGCEEPQQPASGGCYYDYTTFQDCVSCCESYSGFSNAACIGTFSRICSWSWCRGGGAFVCGQLVEFASSYCRMHNCRGKPGDPGCDQSAACEGTCMSFCGPGWSSGCGHCNGEGANHAACCR